jgi:hypothetical protein
MNRRRFFSALCAAPLLPIASSQATPPVWTWAAPPVWIWRVDHEHRSRVWHAIRIPALGRDLRDVLEQTAEEQRLREQLLASTSARRLLFDEVDRSRPIAC